MNPSATPQTCGASGSSAIFCESQGSWWGGDTPTRGPPSGYVIVRERLGWIMMGTTPSKQKGDWFPFLGLPAHPVPGPASPFVATYSATHKDFHDGCLTGGFGQACEVRGTTDEHLHCFLRAEPHPHRMDTQSWLISHSSTYILSNKHSSWKGLYGNSRQQINTVIS